MAKPLGPNLDRSLVTEPPPDPQEQVAGEDLTHFSEPLPENFPAAEHPPEPWPATDESVEPWPATEEPPGSWPVAEESPAPAFDEVPAVELPPDTWEEAAAFPEALPGEYPVEDAALLPAAEAEPPAQAVDAEQWTNQVATQFWEETIEARAQDAEMDQAESPPLYPGRRSLFKRSDPTPSPDEQLAEVITFLQNLQTTIQRAATQPEAPSPAALGLSLLQLRRLSRTGVAPDHFEIGVLPKPPRVEAAPATEADPDPEAEAMVMVPPADIFFPPEPPARLERRHAVWLVLTGLLCLVTLGLVAYLWTRVDPFSRTTVSTSKSPTARGKPGPTPEAEVSEETLHLANLALEVIQQGDLKKASDLLARARRQGVVLPGLNYQAALLAFNQGQAQEADNLLERSIAANEAVSDCWYLRANATFFTANPGQAAEDFEQAIYATPFSPRFYFFRAECLRRNGNTVAAVGQFQQALRCRPNSSDTELILFKIGLTKIETNTDLIFKTELHDRLSQEPVSGDTLLLAAAEAISRNEFAEAADDLRRAAVDLPSRTFQSRVRDYFFQSQAKQPDVAAALILTFSASTRRPSNVPDPTARTGPRRSGQRAVLAEADPAGW